VNDGMTVPLGEGFIKLEPDEVKELLALGASGAWVTLRKVLSGFQEAAQVALRDVEAPIERMRVQQGRISAVQDLVRLVDEDAPAWYKSGTKED